MPRAYDRDYFLALDVPEHLLPLVMDAPRLLPGERREDFLLFFEAMVNELLPDSDLEWLLAVDLAWIYREIERYRRWKNAIIAVNQRAALEEALVRSDPLAPASGPTQMIRGKARMTVNALAGDAKKDRNVAAQLAEYGYDDDALNATAFMKGMLPLAEVEKFLASARRQLTITLREAIVRREFKLRAEQLERRLRDENLQNKAKQRENGKAEPSGSAK
jgi:hypothetical protein